MHVVAFLHRSVSQYLCSIDCDGESFHSEDLELANTSKGIKEQIYQGHTRKIIYIFSFIAKLDKFSLQIELNGAICLGISSVTKTF